MKDNQVKPHPSTLNQIKQDHYSDTKDYLVMPDPNKPHFKGGEPETHADHIARQNIYEAISKVRKWDELKKYYDAYYSGSKTEDDLMAELDRLMK
jgi:hypothetical protein